MNEIFEEFVTTVTDMRETHENGTYYWPLRTDSNNNHWAFVLGWSDGFDENEKDDYTKDTYRLCAKLAYQPHNRVMQSDYDVDWDMPYDEKTGEVDNTGIAFYPDTNIKEAFNWLLECYEKYKDR